jgi:hypothetical protein
MPSLPAANESPATSITSVVTRRTRRFRLTHAIPDITVLFVDKAPAVLGFVLKVFENSRRRRITLSEDAALALSLTLLVVGASRLARVRLERARLVLLVQVALQQPYVLRIRFESRVCEITHEWNQANEEVDQDVDKHLDLRAAVESTFDCAAFLEDHQGDQTSQGITKGWHDADDGFPTEADAEEGEEATVHFVGAGAHFCKHFGIVLGNVGWNDLLDFLHFASALWIFNVGEEWVLRICQWKVLVTSI